MVPPTKKRKLPSTTEPAPKRSKNLFSKSKKSKKGSAAPRRAVDADSLAWQTVGEEFGGLEVIEGVNIVKDGERVQFVVAAESQIAEDAYLDDADEPFEGFGDDAVEGGGVVADKGAGDEDGVEGQGGQEEVAGQAKQKKKADKKQDVADKKKQQADKKQSVADKKQKQSSKDDGLAKATKNVQKSAPGGNAFDALAAMADADDAEETDMADWVPLNLSQPVLSAIAKLKFAKPTTIQEQTIPEIMAGGDVIGKAQTGSGKTLAFGIPMVEKWLEMYVDRDDVKREGPMAVVLSPTRELAKQLGEHLKALCEGLPTGPYVCVVTGGLSIQKQQRQLEKADIVIGTPGRLWEVLDGDMKLQDAFAKIRFLVVDEADRLFKAGQFKEAEDIIGALDKRHPDADSDDSDSEDDEEKPRRQTLVFSATFDKNLQTKLAGNHSKRKGKAGEDEMEYLMKCLKFRGDPKFIDVNPVSKMATGLKEGLVECGAMEKDLYLYTVLLLNPGRRTLVFANSISAVRRLTPLLTNLGLNAHPLHSQMIQKARHRSLERFSSSKNSILIATDVAARGLDIKEVDQVLHYHVPRSADTYIHRSGRTARGDNSGVSVILCSPEEVISARRLTAKVHAQKARSRVMQTLDIDRKIASRLKPRVDLSKKLADAVLAKEKAHSDDAWLRNTADELGVEYDSEDFDATGGAWGRGGGRKKKEKEASGLTKHEMGALRAQLREELSRRVNLGVSEKYISGGRVDVGALLREGENKGIFLGKTDGLGFEK